jgi:hypothetical protein
MCFDSLMLENLEEHAHAVGLDAWCAWSGSESNQAGSM